MSKEINFDEIIGVKFIDLNEKQCKNIIDKKDIIKKLYEVINNNYSVEIGKFIYLLAENDKHSFLIRSLIPALIYRVLCSPTSDIMAAFLNVYNSRFKNSVKQTFSYPFMSNPSVFYKPTVSKSSSKLTKQNLTVLEVIKKQSELDEKTKEFSSLDLSNEEIDVMLAFLIRDFGNLLVTLSNDIHQIYLQLINEIIEIYLKNSWNLSYYFSIELSMTLCYLIEGEDKTLYKEVFEKCNDFAQMNNNFQMLLVLTQLEEFLSLHSNPI